MMTAYREMTQAELLIEILYEIRTLNEKVSEIDSDVRSKVEAFETEVREKLSPAGIKAMTNEFLGGGLMGGLFG